MKKRLMLVITVAMALMLPTIHLRATEGDSLWSHTYGGSVNDGARSIIPSGDGGYLLAGMTDSFGAGNNDMWLVKVNSGGDSIWSHTYGGTGNEFAQSIIRTEDGGFLLAGYTDSYGTYGDMWLIKVNSQGDSLWSHNYGGSNSDEAYSIIPSGDGGFLLAGSTYGPSENMWLIKVTSQGELIWSHSYGGSGEQVAYSIIPSGDGGFLLVGSTQSFGPDDVWLVKVNSQGDSLWSRAYGGSSGDKAFSIIPSGDGGFLIAGYTSSFGAGSEDIWLLKVNAQGDSLWSHTYGGSGAEEANSIIPAGDGGFMLVGWTQSFGSGTGDMWLVKVGSQGDSLWSHTYGGIYDEYAYSIIPSGDNGFLLAGGTESFGAGFTDMWLAKVEGPGTPVSPEQLVQPKEFTFNTPHPNPFNPTTVLSFGLPTASFVNLNIYDISGRLVSTLVNGWREAGRHEVTFDGAGLASGIYVYRMEAGEWQGRGKMVLVK